MSEHVETPEEVPATPFVEVHIHNTHFAQVRWGVGAREMAQARARLDRHWHNARLVLRLSAQPQEGGGARALDVPLRRWFGSQLVPLGQVGAVHRCAVGLVASGRGEELDDVFVALARSAPFTAT